MQNIHLFEMTRPEVEQAIAAGFDTVIVPLGSTEQTIRGTLLTKDTNPCTCDYEMRKKNRVGMGRWSK